MMSPLVVLIACSVGVGILASFFIVLAVSTDSWETIEYRTDYLGQYAVLGASAEYNCTRMAGSDTDYSILERTQTVINSNGTVTAEVQKYYLYSIYTGVWRTCDMLSDTNRADLESRTGSTVTKCYVFVTEYDEEATNLPDWMKSIGRMQNSAASCFIVSLIDLTAAAAVGAFAILQKQVSACMVTGVLYCMAGLFCVFGLTIFHTKMYYERYQCYSFHVDKLPEAACAARVVSVGWSIPLAWVGVIVSCIAFGLWIFVTRAFRVIKSKTML